MIPARHFYMIRHGQTEANAARIMAGALDSPLTERGKDQARAVHPVFSALRLPPRRIIHSHLSRARETAEILNESLGLTLEEDRDYGELDAGAWEGQPYEICRPLMTDWVDPPGGEPYATFFERVRRAKKRALSANTDTPPMIVAHGGVFRAFWQLYGFTLHGVQNCRLYEFEPKPPGEQEKFPWRIWRYDIGARIQRREINPETQAPDSEIRA